MRTRRVLATIGSVVVLSGVGAVVVGMAAAQPGSVLDPIPGPLPSARGLAPVSLSAPGSATAASSTAPAPASRAFDVPRLAQAQRTTAPPDPTASSRAVPRRPVPAYRPPPRTTSHRAPAPPATVRGQSLPLTFTTGSATRVVTVVASGTTRTTATLQAWDRAPGGGWLRHGAPVLAHVGAQGLTSSPSETLSATPIGSFTLTQAFGRLGDPGTALPYYSVGSDDWWVSDTASSLYNTHQRCSSCSFDTGASENLYRAGSVYDYAVVIDYNRSPVRRGAGSAFFLHVTDGGPTAGCVSVPRDTLVGIMRWLLPGGRSRILIGVG